MDATFRLTIDGCSARLRVTRIEGVERVHAPFRFEILAHAEHGDNGPLLPDDLVGRAATIELAHESDPRLISGVVDGIDEIATGYRFIVASRVTALSDGSDHRVCIDQDAATIAESVLREHGIEVKRRLARTLPSRPQCVQAFESDLAFVTRILADEGILWHLEHDGRGECVVLTDNPGAYLPIVGAAELRLAEGEAAGLRGEESVIAAVVTRAVTHDKVSLGDYDFERPLVEQTVSDGEGPLERYEYPGGHQDPAAGRALAKVRREEAQARSVTLRARTTSRRLAPGATFKLTGAMRDELDGTWLVVELRHRGADHGAATADMARRYEAELVAVPVTVAHRPPRPQAPRLCGVQTATTAGPSGAEIHTEKHGRIKALLRWDRRGKQDDTCSAWVRPVQPPTSGGFFLPRAGWEVLLGFSHTSADEPYELGRMYNAEAPPPAGLPAKKMQSAFGTLTTPRGGSANQLGLDDAAGSEGMSVGASSNYNERTENDKGTTVKASDVHAIGANHKDIIGIAHSVTVDAAQTYTVGGSRDLTTVGTFSIDAASESVSVAGLRLFKVGGDYETHAGSLVRSVGALKAEVAIQEVNRHVTGASTVLVGGSWTEIGGLRSSTSVLGASTLTVGGPMSVKAKDYSLKASALKETYASRSVKAGGKRVEGFGGPAKYAVGGSMKMKGSQVFFKAAAKITIKASGVTITITPSAIKISGAFDSSEASIITGKDINE
jgi:type VI secretion system secreted protein VgrG